MLQETHLRKSCSHCLRPLQVCYCSALVQIANQIKVLIIQHPLEQKHPFNTGRMAHLCLKNSELIVAEKFSISQLDDILATPSTLLYPSLAWLPSPSILDKSKTPQGATTMQQIIVLDATWRKSKKILHLNPQLQNLPRLSLKGNLQSNYQIRKTTQVDGLSTIESIIKAMNYLEPKQDFQPMLKPFEKMIELQGKCLPR